MKWLATLKWEIRSDVRSTRWIIPASLVILGLLMLLSLPTFGMSGGFILWIIYMLGALGGAYLAMAHPILTAVMLLKHGLAERLSGRPLATVMLVRIPLNLIITGIGFALLYLASIAHQRLELTQFEFMYFVLTIGNAPVESQIGRIIESMVNSGVIVPSYLLLFMITLHIGSKRLMFLVRLMFIVPLIALIVIHLLHDGLSITVYSHPLAWLTTLAVSFGCIAMATWLYETKCDFYEIK